MSGNPDLTEFQARVLVVCRDLQAQGIYPSGEALVAAGVDRSPDHLRNIRRDLTAAGHLPITTCPGSTRGRERKTMQHLHDDRLGRPQPCKPKPDPSRRYIGPCAADIAMFRAAWRRVRRIQPVAEVSIDP